jgi:hypothetical protein
MSHLARKRLYAEDRGLQVPMTLEHHPITSSGKTEPGPDPRIRHRIQIGMFRTIQVDHTNRLQVTIKTHSFTYMHTPAVVHDMHRAHPLTLLVEEHFRRMHLPRRSQIAYKQLPIGLRIPLRMHHCLHLP